MTTNSKHSPRVMRRLMLGVADGLRGWTTSPGEAVIPDRLREDRALAASRQTGLDIPKGVVDAEAIVSAVNEVRNGTLPPLPELPNTPAAVAKVLQDYGAECATIEAAARHCHDFLSVAVDRFNAAVRAAAPGWIDAFVVRFRKQWEAFSVSSGRLPRDLLSHNVAQLVGEDFDTYRDAQDAAHKLTGLLNARSTIGSLFGDSGDLESQFCMVIAVNQSGRDVRWPDLMAGIRSFNSERDSVLRWRALPLSLGAVSLAAHGQVPSRLASFSARRDEALASIGHR